MNENFKKEKNNKINKKLSTKTVEKNMSFDVLNKKLE